MKKIRMARNGTLRTLLFWGFLALLLTACTYAAGADATPALIDQGTLDKWSEGFRNWHYCPGHVIAANPGIEGFNEIQGTDCPTVYQVPGDDKWYMSFIGFDGRGLPVIRR